MTIDYPLGTGFSFAKASYDLKNTTTSSSNQLYNFLVKLALKYPSWFDRDLYIFGESYAGHWIPGISYKILSENRSPNPQYRFNLKGIGLGDPWVDPATQTQFYADFCFQNGLINAEEKNFLKALQTQVLNLIEAEQFQEACTINDHLVNLIEQYSGGINYNNIRDFEPYPVMGEFPN